MEHFCDLVPCKTYETDKHDPKEYVGSARVPLNTFLMFCKLWLDVLQFSRIIFANVKSCSRLQLWVGCFIIWYFWWMFFSSIKEINRLTSKGMSNIYLKVTIEKNWRSQTSILLVQKTCPQVSFWAAATYVWGFPIYGNISLKLLDAT